MGAVKSGTRRGARRAGSTAGFDGGLGRTCDRCSARTTWQQIQSCCECTPPLFALCRSYASAPPLSWRGTATVRKPACILVPFCVLKISSIYSSRPPYYTTLTSARGWLALLVILTFPACSAALFRRWCLVARGRVGVICTVVHASSVLPLEGPTLLQAGGGP